MLEPITDPPQKSTSKACDVPEWCQIGESVLIRPVNHSGVISFIGETHFQVSFLTFSCLKTNFHCLK